MALLWADGFEHYGTGSTTARDNMLAGGYGVVGSFGMSISGTQARTGSLSLRLAQSSGGRGYVRKALPGAGRNEVGFAYGLFLESLPPDTTNSNNQPHGCMFRDVTNILVSIGYRPDGSIEVFNGAPGGPGSGNSVGSTDPDTIGASAFHHIELAALIDPIVGWIELRVDGVTVFRIDDLDTGNTLVTNIEWGASGSNTFTLAGYYDDVIAWDGNGAINNSFYGPARVNTVYCVADTAQADWTPNTGDGYAAIDDVVPDGDTTYISASTVGNVSEFAIGQLPDEVDSIAGVYIPTMAKIGSAGVGNIQVSLVSNGEVASGPDTPLTTSYTYWPTVLETNPDGDVPWTKATFEAALLRVEKTA